jgi:3-hydroxybutyryl-CoA dehydratase
MTMNPSSLPQTATPWRSARLSVTESAIRAYAELTDDFNPIHLDAAFAATTPMGRPIAHGTLSLCLIWQSVGLNFPAATLGDLALDVRFVKPVYIGDELTAGGEPDASTPGQWKVWVRAQDGADRVVGTLQPR